MLTKSRVVGLDITRCAAVVMVFLLHGLSWLGYYDVPVRGVAGLGAVALHNLCMSAVPLFLVLSGYLKKNKKADAAHYRTILPILVSMILAVCVLSLYVSLRDRTLPSAAVWLASLLDFSQGYNWYIEMYIGLFLLMPLLNACWNANRDKRWHQTILAVCIALIVLPSLVNGHTIRGVEFQFVPDWWSGPYPIVYYFIGAYMADHPPRLSRKLLAGALLLEIAVTLVRPGFYEEGGLPGRWEDYSDWSVVLVATTVFLLLSSLRLPQGAASKAAAAVADCSLDMYLISVVFDNLLYRYLKGKIPAFPAAFPLLLLTVTAVFTCSFGYAWLKRKTTAWLGRHIPALQGVITRP